MLFAAILLLYAALTTFSDNWLYCMAAGTVGILIVCIADFAVMKEILLFITGIIKKRIYK